MQQLTSVAACADLFKQTVAKFGIHAFACGEIDLAERDRNVMFIAEWPKAWVRYYVKSGLVERDPILNALKVCRSAFSFNDIRHDQRFSNLDREMLRAAAEAWLGAGPGGADFARRRAFRARHPDWARRRIRPGAAHLPCLISECLLTRIRSLGAEVDYALPPAGMSRREIEAVRLVALGFSDEEIAAKLGISASTAHHHVESARKPSKGEDPREFGRALRLAGHRRPRPDSRGKSRRRQWPISGHFQPPRAMQLWGCGEQLL